VAVSGQTTTFVYDGDGNLVKKIKPDNSKTIYVGGVYEVDKTSAGTVTRTEHGFRLLGGTRYYWAYTGLAKLGFRIYREALARNKENENTLAQGLTLDGAAIFAMLLGERSMPEHIERAFPFFGLIRITSGWGWRIRGRLGGRQVREITLRRSALTMKPLPSDAWWKTSARYPPRSTIWLSYIA